VEILPASSNFAIATEFSTLATAVTQVGLVDALSDPEATHPRVCPTTTPLVPPLLVFHSPLDPGIQEAPHGDLSCIMPVLLVLFTHRLKLQPDITMLNGRFSRFVARSDTAVTVTTTAGQATVITADVEGSNGSISLMAFCVVSIGATVIDLDAANYSTSFVDR
jgi:hypothetical protein